MILRRKRNASRAKPQRPGGHLMHLQMVPMIDVVFLLLVFFLLTANFRLREGFLPAELPRRVTRAALTEVEPLEVRLDSQVNGDCLVHIGTQPGFVVSATVDGSGFETLVVELRRVIETQRRHGDDPVKLMPSWRTKWDHVAKAYDAIWQLDLENIIFALAD